MLLTPLPLLHAMPCLPYFFYAATLRRYHALVASSRHADIDDAFDAADDRLRLLMLLLLLVMPLFHTDQVTITTTTCLPSHVIE